MPKKTKTYGPDKFITLTGAYNRYIRDRHAATTNPTLAPRNKFAQIWGWTKKKGK